MPLNNDRYLIGVFIYINHDFLVALLYFYKVIALVPDNIFLAVIFQHTCLDHPILDVFLGETDVVKIEPARVIPGELQSAGGCDLLLAL